MDRTQLEAIFDRQAPGYDQQWARLAAFRDGLHLLLEALFRPLPAAARLLCVGAGTGAEIEFLAQRFPDWHFTAVEPSAGMVQAGRARAQAAGYADRCSWHHGYLETLPNSGPPFAAATCLLVSQFILDRVERVRFFADIARRLHPAGILASADLAADLSVPAQRDLLQVWLRTLATVDAAPEQFERMRAAYAQDVAILPPAEVVSLLKSAGFATPDLPGSALRPTDHSDAWRCGGGERKVPLATHKGMRNLAG